MSFSPSIIVIINAFEINVFNSRFGSINWINESRVKSLSSHIFVRNHADSFRIRRASRSIKRTCITRRIRASYRFTLIGFYALYMHAAMDIRVHGPPRVRRLPYSILFCQYEIPNLQLHASVHDRPRTRFRFSLLIVDRLHQRRQDFSREERIIIVGIFAYLGKKQQ